MSSELRFNLLKGEWVLFAPKRADTKKPQDIFEKKREATPKSACPFDHLEKTGNLPPYFGIPEKKWRVLVFPNKFPGVNASALPAEKGNNPLHSVRAGYGYHDLLIAKGHGKNFCDLPPGDVRDVFRAIRKRYLQVSSDPRIEYISVFQNWGPSAGATLFHPHMQMIALPVVPSHISHELMHSSAYFKKYGRCLYCDMVADEKKEKRRIVFENKRIIAFVPYAAQEPYEVLIAPKKHEIFFEKTSDGVLDDMAEAFRKVLKSVEKKTGADYNAYLHTAPATNGGSYANHHWYIRVLPRTNYSAGFELGTGVEMNPVFPEDAAKILKTK